MDHLKSPTTTFISTILFLFLSFFSTTVLSTTNSNSSLTLPHIPPPVCFYSIYQNTADYTLCRPLSPDSMINDPVTYVSWCSDTNIFAKNSISFKDPNVACNGLDAHCVEAPNPSTAPNPQCFDPITGLPSTSNYAVCPYLRSVIPFELMTFDPVGVDTPLQYLALYSQDGLAITDMNSETIVYNASYMWTQDVVFSNVVSPTNFTNFAYLVAGTFSSIYVSMVTLFDRIVLFSPCEFDVGKEILYMDTFYDYRYNVTYATMLLTGNEIRFYPINMKSDGSGACLDASTMISWLLASDGSVDLSDVSFSQFMHITPNHSATIQTGCFPPLAFRSLVGLATTQQVFVFGLDATTVGQHNVTLSRSSANKVYDVLDENFDDYVVISSFRIFGECFGNIIPPSQMLWLTVALNDTYEAAGSISSLHFISLNEYSLHPLECDIQPGASGWWWNPGNARNFNGSCTTITQVCPEGFYAYDDTTCTKRTQEIEYLEEMLSGDTMHYRMQTAPENKLTTLTDDSRYYQHLLFLTTADNLAVIIYAFQEITCNTTTFDASFPIITEQNRITLVHPVQSLHVSENGQHMFVTFPMLYWQIASQTRLLEICSILAADNDTDPFLAPYQDTCTALTPTAYNIYDYMAYYSECTRGTSCWHYGDYKDYSREDFGNTFISFPPLKYYSLRPTCQYLCEPGFFCPGIGLRFECLQGYMCPDEGQEAPTECPTTPYYDTTCIYPRLTEPAPCPDGMVCLTPFSVPNPAPPGYYVTSTYRDEFYPCAEGDWCALQRFNSTIEGGIAQDLSCLAGTSCVTPNITEPIPCKTAFDKNYVRINPYTEYCPEGTITPVPCPPGYYCTTPQTKQICSPTYYCPSGTQSQALCPAGSFCSDPSQKQTCPEGHYCRAGSQLPQKCHAFVVCPEGSSSEHYAISGLLFDIVVIVGLVAAYFIGLRVREKYRLKREDMRASMMLSGKKVFSNELQLKKKVFTIDFEFQNMGLELKTNKKKVLDGVTGKIRHGRVTAVMGPSGAGKTTFLTTLAGKASYGDRTGLVLINGCNEDMSKYKLLMGYVPQEDIMHRELTVKEIIRFSSELRLPPSMPMDDRHNMVNDVIRVLGLWDVRHQPIGDEATRGISGGQRKRVNIGMELVADPTVLFLDEPTSGLDSTSSEEVLSCLRKVADLGLTIVTVLHQPRYEIFQMFHDVLLLGEGGMTVYIGPSEGALPYFNHIGFACPEHTNPPDFFLDVISGRVPRKGHDGFQKRDLFALWNEYKHLPNSQWNKDSGGNGENSAGPSPSPSRATSPTVTVRPMFDDVIIDNNIEPGSINYAADVASGAPSEKSPLLTSSESRKSSSYESFSGSGTVTNKKYQKKIKPQRDTPGFFKQLLLCAYRCLLQQARDLKGLFLDNALVFIAGSLLGALYVDNQYIGPIPESLVEMCPEFMRDKCELPQTDKLNGIAMLVSMATGLTATTASLRCFGMEKVIFWREASSGLGKTAYFLGKAIAQLLNIILAPIVFLSVFYPLTSPRAPFLYYYWILVCLQFAYVGFGYLLSILFAYKNAQLAGVVLALVCAMFGGTNPPLHQLKDNYLTLSVSCLSPNRWAQEAMYITEIERYSNIYNVDTSLQFWGFNPDNFHFDLLMMVAIGAGSRLIAGILLVSLNRDKMR